MRAEDQVLPEPPPSKAWIYWTLAFLLLFLLPAGAYFEENWRGASVWTATKQEIEAQGETFDWQTFIPPAVPDEQNLALVPIVADLFEYGNNLKTGARVLTAVRTPAKNDINDMPYGGPKPSKPLLASWETAKHAELAAWAAYYRTKSGFPHASQPQSAENDVLFALTRYDSFLDALARASKERPLARFPVDWEQNPVLGARMPHLTFQRAVYLTLSLRACARLAANAPDKALEDVRLALRVCLGLKDEPLLISQLYYNLGVNQTLATVWEGLADRRWSAEQLTELQADLERLDLLSNYLRVMRGERAAAFQYIDALRTNHDAGIFPSAGGLHSKQSGLALLGVLIPPGWYDLNKATIARWRQDYIVAAIDVPKHRIFSDKAAAGSRAQLSMAPGPSTILARIDFFDPERFLRRLAQNQVALDQAIIACALERYYLEHQKYPEALDELMPKQLARVPGDVLDGNPLRYRQISDGRYLLYSVGWDAHDDSGRIAYDPQGKFSPTAGDWVWRYSDAVTP